MNPFKKEKLIKPIASKRPPGSTLVKYSKRWVFKVQIKKKNGPVSDDTLPYVELDQTGHAARIYENEKAMREWGDAFLAVNFEWLRHVDLSSYEWVDEIKHPELADGLLD